MSRILWFFEKINRRSWDTSPPPVVLPLGGGTRFPKHTPRVPPPGGRAKAAPRSQGGGPPRTQKKKNQPPSTKDNGREESGTNVVRPY